MALARNSLLSLLPTLAGVAVSLVTVPIYIAVVGSERYGALLIAWLLLGYFGQADFGIGRAITQRLSSMRGADQAEQAGLIWSGLLGATLISAIGAALIFIAVSVFFGSFFEAPADLKAEAQDSAWLFALCIPVIMYTGVATGALIGVERFGVVSLGTTVGSFLTQILPLVAAVLYSNDLSWLLGASLVGRVVGLVPIFLYVAAVFLKGQPVNPSLAHLRHLLSYGSWIMVTAIVGPFMVTADRLVIGAVAGAAAVVAYSVPFQVSYRTVLFPTAIVQALFPRLASTEQAESVEIGKSAVVIVGQLYGFMVLGLICLASPLLHIWLGDDLDQRSILVGQITMIGFWTNALANVPYALIQARGNSRFTALLHLLELPLYVAMLYGFGSLLGLYGVAIAFSLRCTLDCVVLFYKARFFDPALLMRLLGPALLVAIAMAAAPWMTDWLTGIAGASILCSCLLLITCLQMPREAKDWLVVHARRWV